MYKKIHLAVLGTGMLCMPLAWADCNRPSTTYEQQDCNFKSERDFRRGNSAVDQEAQRYLESLKRNEKAEQLRQAEQNRLDRLEQEREENLRRARAITQNLDRMEASATALMNARKSDECISVADQMAEVAVTDLRAVALRISGLCHLQNHGNETKGDARYRNQEFALGESKLKAALLATENQYGSQNPRTHDFVRTLWAVYAIHQREEEAKAIKQRYGLWTASDEEAFEAKRQAALEKPAPAAAPTPPAAAVNNLKTDREAQKQQAAGEQAVAEYRAINTINERLYAGKYELALIACDDAMRMAERHQTPDLSTLALEKKAEALIKLKRAGEAEAVLMEALAKAEKSSTAKNQATRIRTSLAALRDAGKRDK